MGALTIRLYREIGRRSELREIEREAERDARGRQEDYARGEYLALAAGARSAREWAYRLSGHKLTRGAAAAQADRASM